MNGDALYGWGEFALAQQKKGEKMNSEKALWTALVEQSEKKLARDPGESDFDLIQRAIAKAPDRGALTSRLRSTHTFVTVGVSQSTLNEVVGLLRDAEYHHAITGEEGQWTVDMHGLALVLVPLESEPKS